MSVRSPALMTLLLLSTGLLLAGCNIGDDLKLIFAPAGTYDAKRLLLHHATLPRFATALLVGSALGLSGVILQQCLRNPLASPTTLGTSAGANLALALAMLFTPTLQGIGRDTIAICGSAISACLVVALSSRRGASPLSFVLVGMMVGLWCGAFSAILVLLNDRFLSGLFIWGAGSLSLQSWAVPLELAPKLLLCAICCTLLVRPLALMELGDAGAVSAGIPVKQLRLAAIFIALALSALVTSAVGMIGFVGLVAPAIARLCGARRFHQQLAWSPAIGAALLLLTDEAVKMVSAWSGAFIPTGAMTALFGAPIVLLLLSRMRQGHRTLVDETSPKALPTALRKYGPLLIIMLAIAGLVGATLIGRAPNGQWELLSLAEWSEVLPYRWPRVVAAFAAAIMLGCSGVILQRLTGNEMASPELLGISAGATGGVAITLFVFASSSYLLQVGFAALGSLAVIITVLLLSFRSGFASEKILLTGIVLTALLDALIGFVAASGDPRAMTLIAWMSGSTYLVTPATALIALSATIVFTTASFLLKRWLDLLPLGIATALGVGINVTVARAILLTLAAAMAAAATVIVGPLSFVGLVGPHIARELGMRGAARQLAGGAISAALLMIAADWLGRMMAFPYQIPAGLIAVLIGAPILVMILMRGSRRPRLLPQMTRKGAR